MAAIIITLIFCAITAAVTFSITRSLYINHYKDWYRTAVGSDTIEEESLTAKKEMYDTLFNKYCKIYDIDHTIIPEYVKDAFEFAQTPITSAKLREAFQYVRWLGYDLTLTKRQLPPPPKFKLMASPSAIREELVECMEAEARNEATPNS